MFIIINGKSSPKTLNNILPGKSIVPGKSGSNSLHLRVVAVGCSVSVNVAVADGSKVNVGGGRVGVYVAVGGKGVAVLAGGIAEVGVGAWVVVQAVRRRVRRRRVSRGFI
jgi:hypothetical protein